MVILNTGKSVALRSTFKNSMKIIITRFPESKSALKNVWNMHLCNNYTSDNLREKYERKQIQRFKLQHYGRQCRMSKAQFA